MAATFVSAGGFFRWGLSHVDLLIAIGDAAAKLPGAGSYVERWEICKPVGDKIAPAIDELLSPLVTTTEDLEAALLAAVNARPHVAAGLPRDGRWLKAALTLVQLLIPLLTQ